MSMSFLDDRSRRQSGPLKAHQVEGHRFHDATDERVGLRHFLLQFAAKLLIPLGRFEPFFTAKAAENSDSRQLGRLLLYH
jgi:hypothetical protein